MKVEHLVDAIGNIDDKYIENARKVNRRRTYRNILGVVAAGVMLALALPWIIMGGLRLNKQNDSAEDKLNSSGQQGEVVIVHDDITIYYVQDGDLKTETEYLECTAESVFAAWKEKNGIGDEVVLIDFLIENNGTTTEEDGMVSHTIGNYFVLHITVSKELENYYGTLGEELLLQSLKDTMTGYLDIDFDEYYLQLQ